MTQKTFSNLLKAVIILAFLCVAVVYALYVPAVADECRTSYPELASLYLPALIFIELTAAPVLAAFVLSWFIARDIGRDQSFTRVNARRMKAISFLALADDLISARVKAANFINAQHNKFPEIDPDMVIVELRYSLNPKEEKHD